MSAMTEHSTHSDHAHSHGPDCGHQAARHDDHVDFLHDNHAHHQHGDHWDECPPGDRAWSAYSAIDQLSPTEATKRATSLSDRAERLRTSTGS